jgi:hypothetical protein
VRQAAGFDAKFEVAGDGFAERQLLQLHHRHEWYGPTWWLSDGKRVADEVAQLVIKNPAVVGVGDALPLGTDVPAQTFRYVE